MKNIELYNQRMSKSMGDKMFFDKYLSDEATVFIDFGCADAALIKILAEKHKDNIYIGYDSNPEMIRIANDNLFNSKKNSAWEERLTNVTVTDDWNYLHTFIGEFRKNGQKTVLILSSVLHEVQDKKSFMDFLNLSSFDYVVIRDMFFSGTFNNKLNKETIIEKLPTLVTKYYGDKLKESPPVLLQAMFKGYYLENLDLVEMLEDYFSFTIEDLDRFIKVSDEIVLMEKFFLPYWGEVLLRDYNMDYKEQYDLTSHIKLILKI